MYTHPNIAIDLTSPNAAGYYPVTVDKATPFAYTQWWYVQITKGGKQACKPFNAEVCGSEVVTSNWAGGTNWGLYQKSFTPGDTDTPIAPNPITFFSVDSTYCNILTYDVVMDDGLGGYTASSHLSLVGTTLHLDETLPTSGPLGFIQTHYVRACTTSGRC